MVRSLSLTMALALTMLLATPGSPVRAAAPAVARAHMASQPGANQPRTDRFPAGARTVFFDYTVAAPLVGTDAEVQVRAGSASGPVLAHQPLLLDLASSFYVAFDAPGGRWPAGAYCTVLTIDGTADSANGRMPVGWAVGDGVVPGCGRATMPQTFARVRVRGSLRIGVTGTLRITVRDSADHPVVGATVRLDGSGAGIASLRHALTGPRGTATFGALRPTHRGWITLTASKHGYHSLATRIRVSH